MNNVDNNSWPALDVFKFICIIVLVFIHAHFVTITDSYSMIVYPGFYYSITSNLMFIGAINNILPILAGCVFMYNFRNNLEKGKIKVIRIKKIFFMALSLSLFGIFMNILTWGLGYAFSWNILQLVAVSLLMISLLAKYISIHAVTALSLLAFFLTEPLKVLLGDYNHIYFISILIGADNHFVFWQFFPWFSFIGLGFIISYYYLRYKDRFSFYLILFIIGICFVATAIIRNEFNVFLDPNYTWGPSLFQPPIGWLLNSIGIFLILFVVLNKTCNNFSLKRYGIVNCFSKGILWIYILQMIVSYHLSYLLKDILPIREAIIHPNSIVDILLYFILPVFMMAFSWLIGYLSIKLLGEMRIVIKLRPVR